MTDRQKQMLSLAADGLTREEIAEKCGVTVEAVRNALKAVFKRLGAKNIPHAVALGIRQGLI